MAKKIENGWYDVTENDQVYVEDGMVVRATKADAPASVYRWEKQYGSYVNACPIKYSSFVRGWNANRLSII